VGKLVGWKLVYCRLGVVAIRPFRVYYYYDRVLVRIDRPKGSDVGDIAKQREILVSNSSSISSH